MQAVERSVDGKMIHHRSADFCGHFHLLYCLVPKWQNRRPVHTHKEAWWMKMSTERPVSVVVVAIQFHRSNKKYPDSCSSLLCCLVNGGPSSHRQAALCYITLLFRLLTRKKCLYVPLSLLQLCRVSSLPERGLTKVNANQTFSEWQYNLQLSLFDYFSFKRT